MKITFYELLRLVKDGKAPKKIKYGNIELEYDEECEDYYSYYGGGLFEYKFGNCKDFLNDELETIEETKKINKIRIDYNSINIDKAFETGTTTFFREKDIEIFQCLSSKINELIDEIQNLKGKEL